MQEQLLDLAGEKNIEATHRAPEGSRGKEQEVNGPDGRSEKSSQHDFSSKKSFACKRRNGEPKKSKGKGVIGLSYL